MSLAIEILLLLICSAISACIILAVVFVARPIATTFWLRRSALLRSGFRKTKVATTVGIQTVFRGGEGPVVVLLHGAGDQAGTWHRIAPDLEHQFQLVMPDLAGHGESGPAKERSASAHFSSPSNKCLRTSPALIRQSCWSAILSARGWPCSTPKSTRNG